MQVMIRTLFAMVSFDSWWCHLKERYPTTDIPRLTVTIDKMPQGLQSGRKLYCQSHIFEKIDNKKVEAARALGTDAKSEEIRSTKKPK